MPDERLHFYQPERTNFRTCYKRNVLTVEFSFWLCGNRCAGRGTAADVGGLDADRLPGGDADGAPQRGPPPGARSRRLPPLRRLEPAGRSGSAHSGTRRLYMQPRKRKKRVLFAFSQVNVSAPPAASGGDIVVDAAEATPPAAAGVAFSHQSRASSVSSTSSSTGDHKVLTTLIRP